VTAHLGTELAKARPVGLRGSLVANGGDTNCRRPFECRAVGVEGRPVHRLIAGAADPCGVPAAVAEAGLMTDENLAWAESMPVGAARRWVDDPRLGRLYQLAQHDYKPPNV
jgi:hypothetical protein